MEGTEGAEGREGTEGTEGTEGREGTEGAGGLRKIIRGCGDRVQGLQSGDSVGEPEG